MKYLPLPNFREKNKEIRERANAFSRHCKYMWNILFFTFTTVNYFIVIISFYSCCVRVYMNNVKKLLILCSYVDVWLPVDVFPPSQTFKLLLCVYLFLTPVRNTVQWIEAMVGMIHQSHHKSNGMFMLTWHSIVKLVVHNSKVDNKCRCSEVWVKVSHCLWQGTHFLGEQTRVCVGNTGEHNTVSVCMNQIPFHELGLNA